MKQLIKPDPIVLKMIRGSSVDENTALYRSQFVVELKHKDCTVFYNTLTKEAISLDENEIMPEEVCFTQPDELLLYLYQHHFMVRNLNEYQTYFSLVKALRSLKRSNAISLYTILPTTYCNARCFYCYEQDFRFKSMSAETEQQLIDYILNTHNKDKFKICWFGGEPLLGIRTIRKVSSVLNESQVNFSSLMITNGSLFDDDVISEAVRDWHLKSVQITLDGTEKEYHRRKNYYDMKHKSQYRKVIDNIHSLISAGIHVKIRLNVDTDNLAEMNELIGFLSNEFIDKSNLYIYAHPLFHEVSSSRSSAIWAECVLLNRKLYDCGFRVPALSKKGKLNLYYCKAANPNAVVIDPSGTIFACEHCEENTFLGSINNDCKSSFQRSVPSAEDIREQCKHCPFLPLCTEFTGCPAVTYDCRKIQDIILKGQLELLSDEK